MYSVSELMPNNSRKSFYGKAHVIHANGTAYLRSYEQTYLVFLRNVCRKGNPQEGVGYASIRRLSARHLLMP